MADYGYWQMEDDWVLEYEDVPSGAAAHYRAAKGIQSHDTLIVLVVIVAGYIGVRRCQSECKAWSERLALKRAADDRQAAARAAQDAEAAADSELREKREALRARCLRRSRPPRACQRRDEEGMAMSPSSRRGRPSRTRRPTRNARAGAMARETSA